MISYVLVVIFCLSLGCEAFEQRIVNGTNAREGEFPFAVSLRVNNRHTCGGTIINENYILTAAHCICDDNGPYDPRNYTIQYGVLRITEQRINVAQVAEIFCHNFNSSQLIYDVAVLRLQNQLSRNVTWEPVKLARNFTANGSQTGVIIGWGRTVHLGPVAEILQRLNVTVYSDTHCSGRFDTFHHVCFGALEAGACHGDSGTALMVNGEQVGIASFISYAVCGVANETFPNVYARVPSYYDWIAGISGGQDFVKMSPIIVFIVTTIAVVLNNNY